MATAITAVVSTIFSFIGFFIYAGVIHKGWGWFITTEFGIAAPSMAVCFGLFVLINLVTGNGMTYADVSTVMNDDDDKSSIITILTAVWNSLGRPILALVILWAAYCIAY